MCSPLNLPRWCQLLHHLYRCTHRQSCRLHESFPHRAHPFRQRRRLQYHCRRCRRHPMASPRYQLHRCGHHLRRRRRRLWNSLLTWAAALKISHELPLHRNWCARSHHACAKILARVPVDRILLLWLPFSALYLSLLLCETTLKRSLNRAGALLQRERERDTSRCLSCKRER